MLCPFGSGRTAVNRHVDQTHGLFDLLSGLTEGIGKAKDSGFLTDILLFERLAIGMTLFTFAVAGLGNGFHEGQKKETVIRIK